MSTQTNFAGTTLSVVVNIIDENGDHVAVAGGTPFAGSTAFVGATDQVLSTPTVTTVATGVYVLTWTGVGFLTEGAQVTVMVHGETAAGAWTPYGIGVNVVKDSSDQTTILADIATLDGKVDTVDSEVGQILADTNELQTNQGAWATATGFATPANVSAVEAKVDAVDLVVDAILLDTAELQTNQGAWVTATGFATSAALAAIDVKIDAVPTANEVYLEFTSGSNEDAFKADVTDMLTATAYNASLPANFGDLIIGVAADLGKVTTSNPAVGGVAHTAADVRDLILAGDKAPIAVTGGAVDTVTDVTNGGGGGDATAANQASILAAIGVVDTEVGLILADTAELQTNQGAWATATGFATPANVSAVETKVDAVLLDTGTTLPASLSSQDTEIAKIPKKDVAHTWQQGAETIDVTITEV